MRIKLIEHNLAFEKMTESFEVDTFKEAYDVIAWLGYTRQYNDNNVTENEYETFIRKMDTRKYSYDVQKEFHNIEIDPLQDLKIIIELDLGYIGLDIFNILDDNKEILSEKELSKYLHDNDYMGLFLKSINYYNTHAWLGGLNSDLYSLWLQAK